MTRPIEELVKQLEGVTVTFSQWCISGLVPDCKCWRCLKDRGEEATEETERAAEERSRIESAAFRKRMFEAFQRGQ